MITLVYSPKQHLPKDMQHSVIYYIDLKTLKGVIDEESPFS